MIVSNSRRVVEEIYHHDRRAPFSININITSGGSSPCEAVMLKLTRIGGFDEKQLDRVVAPSNLSRPEAGESRVHFAVQSPRKTR